MIQFSLHTVYSSDDVFSALLCHPYCMLLCLYDPLLRAVITLTNGITKVTSHLVVHVLMFDDSDLAGHCFLPFHLNRHISVQFGLGAHTQRGDSSFTVFSEEQEALGPVREERGG